MSGRRASFGAIAGVSLLALTAVSGQQPSPPVLRASVDQVVVDVVVTDEHGGVVPGLTADDFEIFERGKPQSIGDVHGGLRCRSCGRPRPPSGRRPPATSAPTSAAPKGASTSSCSTTSTSASAARRGCGRPPGTSSAGKCSRRPRRRRHHDRRRRRFPGLHRGRGARQPPPLTASSAASRVRTRRCSRRPKRRRRPAPPRPRPMPPSSPPRLARAPTSR